MPVQILCSFSICFPLLFLLIHRNYLNNLLINHFLVLGFARVFLRNCHVSVKVFRVHFDKHNSVTSLFVVPLMVCAFGVLLEK